MKITPREKKLHARSRFARSNIPEEKWGTTCSLLEYVHRGQLVIHSCLIYVIFSISRQEGENNGLLADLAGVPLLPPPSRVVSRPNSLPCGRGNDMGRRVEGLKFESGQNLFLFASFLFFSFSFRLFFFLVITVFLFFYIA